MPEQHNDPQEAIAAIHGVSNTFYRFVRAQDAGRGLKGHNAAVEKARARAFILMVGRKPDASEREALNQ
jgi:hypothetical protein